MLEFGLECHPLTLVIMNHNKPLLTLNCPLFGMKNWTWCCRHSISPRNLPTICGRDRQTEDNDTQERLPWQHATSFAPAYQVKSVFIRNFGPKY